MYFESNDAESEEVATMPIEAWRCTQNFLLSDQERNQVGGLSANWKFAINGLRGALVLDVRSVSCEGLDPGRWPETGVEEIDAISPKSASEDLWEFYPN